MKTPPQQFTDDQARRMTEEFIADQVVIDEHLPPTEDLQPATPKVPQSNGGHS
jgi:hypothetical protein